MTNSGTQGGSFTSVEYSTRDQPLRGEGEADDENITTVKRKNHT